MLNYNWTAPLPSMLIHTKVKNKRLMWCICLSMSKKTHQNGINLFYANVPLLYFLCFSNNFREYRNWKFFWSRLMPCSWTNIYLFKVNNRNTRKRYEVCSKFTVFLCLVFLLLTFSTTVLFITLNILFLLGTFSSDYVVNREIYEERVQVESIKIPSYFWSVFSCIRTRNNSVFGHFSCSESEWGCFRITKKTLQFILNQQH